LNLQPFVIEKNRYYHKILLERENTEERKKKGQKAKFLLMCFGFSKTVIGKIGKTWSLKIQISCDEGNKVSVFSNFYANRKIWSFSELFIFYAESVSSLFDEDYFNERRKFTRTRMLKGHFRLKRELLSVLKNHQIKIFQVVMNELDKTLSCLWLNMKISLSNANKKLLWCLIGEKHGKKFNEEILQ